MTGAFSRLKIANASGAAPENAPSPSPEINAPPLPSATPALDLSGVLNAPPRMIKTKSRPPQQKTTDDTDGGGDGDLDSTWASLDKGEQVQRLKNSLINLYDKNHRLEEDIEYLREAMAQLLRFVQQQTDTINLLLPQEAQERTQLITMTDDGGGEEALPAL